jgi:hypothetical protein
VDSLTVARLTGENACHRGSAGVSDGGRALGFRPAFLDRATRVVYPSRYADGRLAPFHVLDGLPAPLVVARQRGGRVTAVKPSVITGFVRDGRFYTRAEAACAAAKG